MAWVKGQSGNPNGRPPGETVPALLDRLLKRKSTDPELTKKEALYSALIDEGIAGNVAAIKEIGDRLEGKAEQRQIIKQDIDPPIDYESLNKLRCQMFGPDAPQDAPPHSGDGGYCV